MVVKRALGPGASTRVSHLRVCLICGVAIQPNERHVTGTTKGDYEVWACWKCGMTIHQTQRQSARYSAYRDDPNDGLYNDWNNLYDDWNDYDYEVDSGYRDDWDYLE